MEQYLMLIDQSGKGLVTLICLQDLLEATSAPRISRSTWPEFEGIEGFAVVQHPVENKLFLLGGRNVENGVYSAALRRFDPQRDLWEDLKPMSTPRKDFGAGIILDQLLCVAGGERSNGKVTKLCESYDLEKGAWIKGFAGVLPGPRKDPACSARGHQLFLSGGSSNGLAQRNLWVLEGYQWHHLDDNYPAEMNANISNHAMVVTEQVLFFIGGKTQINSSESEDDCPPKTKEASNQMSSFKLKVAADQEISEDLREDILNSDMISPWTWEYPRMANARHSAACCLLGDNIYVFGGTNEAGESVNDVERFDIEKSEWKTLFQLPKGDYRRVTCITLHLNPNGPRMRKTRSDKLLTPSGKSTPDQWILW